MKYTLITLLASAIAASATTIVFSGTPVNSNRIVDNTGRNIAAADGASITAGQVVGGMFVSLVGTNGSSTGAVGNSVTTVLDGLWNGQTSNNSAEANDFDGDPIAVLVSLSADSFAVVTTSSTFPANGGGVGDSFTLSIDNITGVVEELSAPGTTFESNRLTLGVVPIPEPSTALLAGLALVGGLVRRRR